MLALGGIQIQPARFHKNGQVAAVVLDPAAKEDEVKWVEAPVGQGQMISLDLNCDGDWFGRKAR
jgi:hypothetical protein